MRSPSQHAVCVLPCVLPCALWCAADATTWAAITNKTAILTTLEESQPISDQFRKTIGSAFAVVIKSAKRVFYPIAVNTEFTTITQLLTDKQYDKLDPLVRAHTTATHVPPLSSSAPTHSLLYSHTCDACR